MFAGLLKAGRQRQNLGLRQSRRRNDGRHPGLAFGERAGLVHDQSVDLLHALKGFGRLDQDASASAFADRHADRHRGGQAKRTGTSDDEDGDRRDQGIGKCGSGTPDRPRDERNDSHAEHGRNEIARHCVRHALNWRSAPLRLADHCYDAREHRVRADLVGAHDQRAGAVHRPSDELVAGFLGGGHRLAGDHGLVHGALALKHFAIDRHAVAGPHAETIADLNQFKRHFLVLAASLQAVRCFGRQFEQGADRAAGLLAGAQFQHLAQQYENGDHGGGFEINRDRAAHPAKSGGKHFRRKGRKEAIEVSGARPEGDQAEHVQAAVHDRRPGAFEEWPPRPQDDRRRQGELNPDGNAWRDEIMQAKSGNVAAHFQDEDRQGQRRARSRTAGSCPRVRGFRRHPPSP